jgi:hypothetical protein
MGIVVVPSFGTDPALITAAGLDAKVDGLATEFNGNIENVNVKSNAAIANSKLNLANISQAVIHSGILTMSAKDFTEAKCADIASATTCTIWATDGNYAHITGTTTITSFGTAGQAGDCRTIVFDSALTLTHNATSLILPSGANITTAAGDTAIVRAETTANARVIAYLRKDGTAVTPFTPTVSNALSGSVIQTVSTQTGAVATGTTVMPIDDTIPQNTEGDEYMTRAITPNNSSNILYIKVTFIAAVSSAINFGVALYQDSTANALAATAMDVAGGGEITTCTFTYKMTAGTTSSTTFKVRGGPASAATLTFNGAAGARLFGGVAISSITIIEVKA